MKKLLALFFCITLFSTPIMQAYHCHNPFYIKRNVYLRDAPRPMRPGTDDSLVAPCLFIVACAAIVGIACLNAKQSHGTVQYTHSTSPSYSYESSSDSRPYDYCSYDCCSNDHCDCVVEETIIIDQRTDTSKPGVYIY